MAKRYIDTNFYKSPFVRGLQGSFKSLYSFIICECSNAGVWIKDFEVATLYTGFKINEKEFNEVFIKSNKLINLGNGKYFLPDFVEFQYPNGLSNSNPAHKNIISELLKFNLLDKNLKVQVSPLSVPNYGTKEKEKVMVMEEDMEKVMEEADEIFKIQEAHEEHERNNPYIPIVEEKPFKRPRKGNTIRHLFIESYFYNFDNFEREFIGTDYEVADAKFYYESIRNWSAEGNKKIDWIATARNFMLRDVKDNKLKLKNGNTKNNDTHDKYQAQLERITNDFREGK